MFPKNPFGLRGLGESGATVIICDDIEKPSTPIYKQKLPTGVQIKWTKSGIRFRARITVNGKWIYLGSYLTAEEAGKAYENALAHYSREQRIRNKP